MSKKKSPSFAFGYGSTQTEACYAFYTADGKCHADYTDESGARHTYSAKEMPEGFWDKLTELAEKHKMFDWKAPRFCKRFVLDLSVGVLNVEALFPNGKKIEANNMNGDPEGLNDAAKDLKELYGTLE